MRFVLSLFILLPACATNWQKKYAAQGRPNLSAKVELDSRFLTNRKVELDIFEERPSCGLFYLGTVELKSGEPNSLVLPVGKRLAIFISRVNRTYGSQEQSDSKQRVHVKDGASYRISLREKNRSEELLFQVSQGGGAFSDLPQLPDRNCAKDNFLNL